MAIPNDNAQAAAQIVQKWKERHADRAMIFNRMEDVRKQYNGDIHIALPELDEMEKPAVANLVAQGIDQFAMRAASVTPLIIFPSLRPGFKEHDERAMSRQKAVAGWFDMNEMQTKRRRRARHLVAYGCSPVSLSPISLEDNDKRKIPRWRVRNPLGTYPAPMTDQDAMEPTDCIFVDYRSRAWIEQNYPSQAAALAKGSVFDDTPFSILEYMDADWFVLVAVGKPPPKRDGWGEVESGTNGFSEVMLSRQPNRSGMCPVVVPGRITLDRMSGQFDQSLGMFHRQAKLDALNTIAVFRDVFPDVWMEGNNPNFQPEIIEFADGATGQIGKVKNANVVTIHSTPGQATQTALSNLERAQRITGQIPSDWSGESGSNIRTARRGGQVESATVDMQLQEYQELFSRSERHEIERAIAIQKAYYGKKPSMYFFGSDGVLPRTDYVPEQIFDTSLVTVQYPLPGADLQQLIIGIGQRLGLGEMSVETAMELDPLIRDKELERERIATEAIDKAVMSGIEQGVVSGQISPITAARLKMMMIAKKMRPSEALMEVDKEMKSEQAAQQNTQAQPPTGADPNQPAPADPNAQPGVMATPATQPTPPAQGQQGTPDLQTLLSQLHQPIPTGSAPPPAARVNVGA